MVPMSSQQFQPVPAIITKETLFQIAISLDNLDFQANFQWPTAAEASLHIHSQTYISTKSSNPFSVNLRPNMTVAELKKIPSLTDTRYPDELHVTKERCFLYVKTTTSYSHTFGDQSIKNMLQSMIHVPGVRNNPERVYRYAATDGHTFTGLFENYVASLIDRWQKSDPAKLTKLQSHMQKLGLATAIQAERLNETQLELRTSRGSEQSSPQDMVNITDVGFGVSQVLPVLVALIVAQPKQLVYIEQPEIHLHPRAQVALAEILAEAIDQGVQVVIETHSELLLLGIQTLVAENRIKPTDVQLHWFASNPNGSSKVTTATLDETGAFGDWPEDFGTTALGLENRYLSAAEEKLWNAAQHG
jgi:AAA domain, putative AbiEii toxin, Type IV TA system/Protein of unknown function (DUF3696)